MSEITSYIEVELWWFGVHSWPGAPDHREYLRPLHQHVWEVRVRISVGHLDRDIEFHDLRDEIWEMLQTTEFDNSCEGVAKSLYEDLKTLHLDNKIAVWVGEEGNVRAKYGEVVV